MTHIKKKTIAKRYLVFYWALLLSFIFLLMYVPAVMSYPDDSIPTLDFGESQKSIIVSLKFINLFEAEIESVKVVPAPSRGKAGDPPILRVKAVDLDGNIIEEFNAWHPLMVYYEDENGNDSGDVLNEASGYFPLPFSQNVANMIIVDVETQQDIISVDVIPRLHDFCRDNPSDPDCDGIVNRPPNCNANGPYTIECAGPSTEVSLDGTGSSDPDGDSLTFDWTGPFSDGQATGSTPKVEFQKYGNFSVSLDVTDEFGGMSTCGSEVSVVDTTPPTIECNAPETIIPPDAPIFFSATASDICTGEINASITSYDCFTFTKKGKRIDKKGSCEVSIDGNTITILDSGGVNDHISWTIVSTDASGNTTEKNCEVLVVNPRQR